MIPFLTSAIEFGVIFLFGCVGEILTEKSGHLNLGIPGIMCMGAAGGCLGVKLCYLASPAPGAFLVVLLAILFAMLFAGALGAVYGFLTVSLRSNQNVTGLACTIFGVGFTSFFLNNAVLTEGVSANLSQAGLNFFNAPLPGAETTGWFGTLFLDHGILVYLAIVIAVIAAVVLRYTKASLSLRAVGENPAADPPAQHRALRRHHPGAHSHQHHRLPRDAAPPQVWASPTSAKTDDHSEQIKDGRPHGRLFFMQKK